MSEVQLPSGKYVFLRNCDCGGPPIDVVTDDNHLIIKCDCCGFLVINDISQEDWVASTWQKGRRQEPHEAPKFTVKNIIKSWLNHNGYVGLTDGCVCDCDGTIACGMDPSRCTPIKTRLGDMVCGSCGSPIKLVEGVLHHIGRTYRHPATLVDSGDKKGEKTEGTKHAENKGEGAV